MAIRRVRQLTETDTTKDVAVDRGHVTVLEHVDVVHGHGLDRLVPDAEPHAIANETKTRNANGKKIENMKGKGVARVCQLLKKSI